MKVKRFALYALAAFVLVLVIQAARAPGAAAAWWNDNWTFCRPIGIATGENGMPEGYIENILLPYDSDQAFENFMDTRFVWENEDGTFELPYWLENANTDPGENIWAWVRITQAIPANTDTTATENLKWYYGNASAERTGSADNGLATFEFFDDFADGDYTSAPVWQLDSGTVSVSSGTLYLQQSATDGIINAPSTLAENYIWEFDVKFANNTATQATMVNVMSTTGTSYGVLMQNTAGGSFNIVRGATTWGADYNVIASTWTPSTTWHTIRVTRDNEANWELFLDGTSKGTANDATNNASDNVGIKHANNNISDAYTDNIRVRKFVGGDATYSIGDELVARTVITQISASASVIDRDVDDDNSLAGGTTDNLTIYVTIQDNRGRDAIENCFLWIRDNTDTAVTGFDNIQLENYDNIDTTTKRFYYADFNPADSSQAGCFDVQAQAVDNSGDSTQENTKAYTDLGYELFTVDDLTVTAALDSENVVYQVGISGAISRTSGAAASAENVRVMDNYQSDNDGGPFAVDNFTDSAYYDNFGLNSPSRLFRGDNGSVYVWARDDNLDGVSSALTYLVEGDNATVTLSSVTNNPDNSTVTTTVKWASDSSDVTSGSTYVQSYETFSATISGGSSSILIDHPSWFYSGAAVVKVHTDNADRPMWNVTGATFETKSITYTVTSLTGDQDNATMKVTLTYKDGTIPITAQIKMRVNDTWYPENAPDENGLVTWELVDLPDNTENIQIVLENCYDTRTDILVGAKDVEDNTAFWENTNIIYEVDNAAVLYGTSGALTGSVTSNASYVTLNLAENLICDNGDLIDNTATSLTPGENETWSMTYSDPITENHFLYFYTDNTWSGENSLVENFRLHLKLEWPTGLVPDNENGTSSGGTTLGWSAVSGAENYTVQYAENDETFASPTTSAVTENQLAVSSLTENIWYWRVRADNENFQSSDWVTYVLWADSTAPDLENFSGPGSTTSLTVTLTLGALDNLGEVWQARFTENTDNWGEWQAYSTSASFTLSSGDGMKTVYAQVRDRAGNTSDTRSTSITKTTPSGGDGGGTTTTTTTITTTVVFTETNPPTLLALTPIPTEVSVSSFTFQVSAADDSTVASTLVRLDNEELTHTFTNGVVTVTVVDLSNGPHVVDIVVADNYNNVSTWTGSFTVKLPPTPVPVEENIEENTPAVPTESLKVENVEAGQEIKFNFVGEVTSITLVPNENAEEMVLTLEIHENLPDLALPSFEDEKRPYCYFETTLRVNETENYSASVASFTFEFKVEKAWMENENISDVKLYRLVDNSWGPVSTRFVRDDFTSRYYEAEVEGLSLFSVVGSQLLIHVSSQPSPTSGATGGSSLAVLLTCIFVGIAALGGGIYYYLRYRLPKRARVEVRRELKEGPYLQEIKRSFGPLIERRVRELEQKMEVKNAKGINEPKHASKFRPKSGRKEI